MRSLVALSLALSGCSLLPHQDIPCAQTELCEPFGPGGPGNPIPTAFVLGQPNDHTTWYTTGLNSPTAVALTPSGQLLVADKGNDRVLLWNTLPQSNNQPPDLSLGTIDSSTAPPGGSSIDYTAQVPSPIRLTTDGIRLVAITEAYDYLIVWKAFPTQNLGPYSFVYSNGRQAAAANNWRTGSPLLAASRLYVTDRDNSRVLIWDPTPGNGSTNANSVLGQTNLTSGMVNGGNALPGPTSLKNPDGSPATDGTKLFVTDTGNNRLLIWNALPTAMNATADVVLGQTDFASNAPNRGLTTARIDSLNQPQGSAAAMNRLVVADTGNNRVLLWSTIPGTVDTPASVVLGQPTATSSAANMPTLSGSSMDSPRSVATDGTHIVVADSDTAQAMGSGDVATLATPRMIALCEQATMSALDGHVDAGFTTVGLSVQVDHLRPTAVGGKIWAEAHLDKVEGRRLCFSVAAKAWREEAESTTVSPRIR